MPRHLNTRCVRCITNELAPLVALAFATSGSVQFCVLLALAVMRGVCGCQDVNFRVRAHSFPNDHRTRIDDQQNVWALSPSHILVFNPALNEESEE